MGATESSLKPQTVKPLVRPDSITPLPSFALDSVKFTNGSVGFLITRTDLAKNTVTQQISLKEHYRPSENSYLYIGTDETVLLFVKDVNSGKILCKIQNGSNVYVRQCVSTYEPIDDPMIDLIALLYKTVDRL